MSRHPWSERPPDEFGEGAEYLIHTRGPHEGERMHPVHVCVPECYEDQSATIDRGHWVDPRPLYRVIATPWYDHDSGDNGHDALACAAGYELEIWIRHPNQLGPLGAWNCVGVTQTNSGGTLDLREVKDVVVDYVRALASPHRVNPDIARIDVYRQVGY